MKVSSVKLQAFLWAIPVFIGSLLVFPYCVLGDQEFYRNFYAGVVGLPIAEAFQFYKDSLGTSEPGYFFFSYTFAPLVHKDLLFSAVNFLFFYHVFLWMLRNDVSRILFPAFYLNFYLLVLAFSAERLKLSLLFFLVGYALTGLFRYCFYAVSILAHVQTLMLLVATQTRRVLFILHRLSLGRVGYGFLSLFFLMVGMALVLVVLREHIASKIGFYTEAWGGWGSILKPLVFMLLSVYYARARWIEALLASLPMVLAAYFVGAERIVIFSYFVFMFYGLQSKRGLNIAVVLTSLYFSYKGVDFLIKAISFGDGFAGAY
ncbi:hypothetical protein BK659_20855 [Pseudomonas brassicacearum]|uniref:EpsG family protein n=1 Tax=Pseudomonas brassicacearum TaxID=930166 RepID=A0A423H3B9_9PSED|nr:hypothetical protein BK659_20855 [Pseudomonas brassicacearum]